MNTKIAYITGTTVGIIILAIAYQALVAVPRERIEATERAAEQKLLDEQMARYQREQNYKKCMATAYEVYSGNWDGQCELLGKGPDCSLVPYQYTLIEERHEKDQERCVTLYK